MEQDGSGFLSARLSPAGRVFDALAETANASYDLCYDFDGALERRFMDTKQALQIVEDRCDSGLVILRYSSPVQHRYDSNGAAATTADFHRQG